MFGNLLFGKVFCRCQIGLKKIVFDNINLHSSNYVKIMTSILGSRQSLTHLDMRTCYYCQSTFDSVYICSCMEQLPYLQTLKLDYYVLSCELIKSILTSKNTSLEYLEVILKEATWRDNIIDDEQWVLLNSVCPKLKVTLLIRNVYHYGELRLYLQEAIPLVSVSLALPRTLSGACNFRKTLNLLVTFYHRTLGKLLFFFFDLPNNLIFSSEFIDLNIKNECEDLDDIILMIIRRCSKLKSFIFNGILENPNFLKAAFRSCIFSFLLGFVLIEMF